MKKRLVLFVRIEAIAVLSMFCGVSLVHATPSTHIWAPSTDIQPFGKVHVTSDFYFPTTRKDASDNHLHVNQVYGLTFSLLSDNPEKNPLGKVMAETGFDYKKGYGSSLDTYPLYFHFKAGVPEGAYFKHMPALAVGGYDLGTERDKTNYNVWYCKFAKSFSIKSFSLGRISLGYFNGNGKLLLDKNSGQDDDGIMAAWERTMTEISDKLWLCFDYQGTQSSYGTMNAGFAWKFSDNVSAIVGYDIYNNRNNTDTVTLQMDIDF